MSGFKEGLQTRTIGCRACFVCVCILGFASPVHAWHHRVWQWSFDTEDDRVPPKGFSFARTGTGRPGQWLVLKAPDATNDTRLLAQLDADPTDFRFPIALVDAPVLANVIFSVKCKPVSGQVDQACGVVFRYQDERNYYLARANALEQNVRLYKVVGGHREQLADWPGPTLRSVWHELRVYARGDHLVVSWDGRRVIDRLDRTFLDAGKVGLWTKADSVTYFDDLRLEEPEP